MEFTIYSTGSAVYLEEILNSVAMICGTGDVESLAKIGFLIGTLLLGFQAVFNNTAIPFQKVLVCLVLYLALYGPSGRAVIEDVYDGEVAVVDNVPLGPLVVGSIVSNIGFNITNIFEQAFSTPAMTKYGFADPIETLMKVRSVTGNLMSIPSFTNGLGANKNLVNSWSNYYRECTLPSLGTDLSGYSDLFRSNDPIGASRFNSGVYYTQIFDGTPGGRTLNCSDAHTALVNLTDSATDSVMGEIATAGFKRPGKNVDADAVTSRIGDSLYALNMSATDARAYTMASILYPIFLQAPGQKAVEDLQGSYGVMMSQAMAQQNTQWAAEGTQFTKYVRPFMTFFEGLIYAITPLMAFLIAMGGFGINLIGKYLMMLVWMILWMPALAIVNLYSISSTASAMEAILQTSSFDAGGTGVSFEMLKQMTPALEQAIGVAGLMASSIPAICLFLVTGATVAASGIASRMNGSDAINEKIVSPDVLTPSAGLQTTPYASNDFDKGLRINGSENQRGNINIGSMLNDTVQSSRVTAQGSSQGFTHQLTSTMGRSLENSKSIGDAANVGHSLQSMLGLENNAAFQQQYSALQAQGYSSSNIDAAIAAITLNGGVNGNVGAKAGVGVDGVPSGANGSVAAGVALTGGVGANKADQSTRSDGSSYNDTLSAVKSSGIGETVKSALSRTDGTTLAKNFQSSDQSKFSRADQDSLSRSAQKTITDQAAYQKVSGLANTFGYSEDMKLDTLAGKLINEGRETSVVNDAMNKYGAEYQENQKMFASTMLDPNRASTAAALYTLAKNHDFEALAGATVNYDQNASLQGPAVGDLEGMTRNAGHSVNTAAFDSRYHNERANALNNAKIGEKHIRNSNIVKNDGEVYAKQTLDPIAERAADRIRNTSNEVTDKGESSYGILAAASNGVGQMVGARASREEYMQEGQQLGLNQAQADVFATARSGALTDNSKERWDQYADSVHMDKNLSEGMYKQLVQAGLHDNGSGGQLADILTLNQRDNIGVNNSGNGGIVSTGSDVNSNQAHDPIAEKPSAPIPYTNTTREGYIREGQQLGLSQAQAGVNGGILRNDGQVYTNQAHDPIGEQAAVPNRNVNNEVRGNVESSYGHLPPASNGVGQMVEARASHEEYMQEGQQLGLNPAQADVFASARSGALTDNSKQRWDQYAESVHMDTTTSDGMYKQLVDAGLHDNGSGGHLSDVLTLNQRDNIGR